MTPKEEFVAALKRRPPVGRVPHFELDFFLTMEALGRVHASHRNYAQWNQMEERERQLQREDMADLYIRVAERFDHCGIFVHPNPLNDDELLKVVDIVKDRTGDKYLLVAHGDATYSLPSGEEMLAFSYRLADEPDAMKEEAEKMVEDALKRGERFRAHGGLDGFALCADYSFNDGPFMSPAQFGEFVTPYLAKLTRGYREMGFYTIKHTDGNINPILDQLVETKPHALHSLDPQGGIDLANVKKQYGDRVCLIGNVNCGLLQTGTDEEAAAAIRLSLESGKPGGGYIFSTSNCVYTGMPLSRYEMMVEIWREEGRYQD